jgi:hypothetical protein
MFRESGVPVWITLSDDDAQLPGVLPDLAGLVELTLARGSLSVVTESAGSSRMRESMVAATSVVGKPNGLDICFEAECEKNSGDGELALAAPAITALEGTGGMLTLRGGDAPVRGFFMGDLSMTCSPLP